MKAMNTVRKYGRKAVAVGALSIGYALPSFAAVSTDVTAALGDAKADVATVGGLVLVVIVAAAAFKYMRRAL
ncbi:Bacteriophage coat protein B [compost metagenome]